MKKLMLLAAMLVMVVVAAVPVMAQVVFELETDDLESGTVEQSTTVASEGDNGSQCAPVLNAGNTGNVQNVQGVLQYASEADDLEFGGTSITVSPTVESACDQTVSQAAAAG